MAMARSTPAQKPRGLARRMSMSDLRLARFSTRAQAVEDKQRRPDGDRAVGKVECRIVPMPPVEKQKVDDVTERQPIPEIPQAAAENQRKARAVPPITAPAKQPDDEPGDRDRDSGKKIARPAARVAQETERRSG